jgi:type IV fimbrial biogenesis protein FimT
MSKPILINKASMAFSARWHRSWMGPRLGFTVIELLAVLALAAIIATLALPAFSALADRWRVRHAIAELQSVMRFANAAAIRTRSRVIIAAKPASCRLLKNTQNWSCGLTVFQDIDHNNVQGPDEPVLRDIPEFYALTVMHAGGNNAFLAYGPHGAPIANPSHFEVYPSSNPDSPATQTICLSFGGRMRVNPGLGC